MQLREWNARLHGLVVFRALLRKVWLCIFYALCIFTIVFSLFWMALPSLPFPADSGEETPASEPGSR